VCARHVIFNSGPMVKILGSALAGSAGVGAEMNAGERSCGFPDRAGAGNPASFRDAIVQLNPGRDEVAGPMTAGDSAFDLLACTATHTAVRAGEMTGNHDSTAARIAWPVEVRAGDPSF
jgi:hypothetical protein